MRSFEASGTDYAWRSAKSEHEACSQGLSGERDNVSVAVLLSTYNGFKYIAQLLDSVLLQRDVSVKLFVRVDGSTDDAPKLLSEYEKLHGNMAVSLCTNVGVIDSFNELMSIPEVALCDYVAFCNQDDVWLKGKLRVAIGKLQANEIDDIPTLYCSNLIIVGEKLNKKEDATSRGFAY